MKSLSEAKALVAKSVDSKEYSINLEKMTDKEFVFLCRAKDPDMVPGTVVVAVNKNTGKIGSSLLSVEEAVRYSRK